MSSKDLLLLIAQQLGKSPTEFQKYIDALEENFLDTIDQLKDVTDEQWKSELKFPIGLVNKIKKELQNIDQPTQSAQLFQHNNFQQTQHLQETVSLADECFMALKELVSVTENMENLSVTCDTLHKIINNILASPQDPKYRNLPKNAKAIQEKVLRYAPAVKFIKLVGFKEEADSFSGKNLSQETLEEAIQVLQAFAVSLGGEVSSSSFNPYQASFISTTGVSHSDVSQQVKTSIEDQKKLIQKLENEREQKFEGKLDDREIEVYNYDSMLQLNRQKKLNEIWNQGKQEDANTQPDPDDDTANPRTLLKDLLAKQQSQGFQDKAQNQINQLQKQLTNTRSRVKIRMPDNYMMLANFGGRETVQDVIDFIQENLMNSQRKFYLFETPPKRVLSDPTKKLYQVKLVPAASLHLGWCDGQVHKSDDGPVLNLLKLKQFVTAF